MTLVIAIIEDEEINANHLSSLIDSWAQSKGIIIKISIFTRASLFLQSFGKNSSFDAILLDIFLPDGNGMDIARTIRKFDAYIPIAFITKTKEFMGEGYNVWAMHYLIKPVTYADIVRCMDRIVDLNKQITDSTFSFKFEGIVRVLNCKDILYFETYQHYIYVHTLQGDFKFRENINALEKKLPEQFQRCNRSTIVNLSLLYLYDAKASYKSIILSDGITIPVSEAYAKDIKEKCFNMLY